MGEKDSTVTRVEPVFSEIYSNRHKWPDWPLRLIRLARCRASNFIEPQIGAIQEPCFGETEAQIPPPPALLRWLVEHIQPPASGLISTDSETLRRREELINRRPDRILEALDLLSAGKRPAWCVFEGPTCPDVCIKTEKSIIVIEGKRTENGPTRKTKWMKMRDQLLRHIDGVWDWEERGNKTVVGLYIVEGHETSGDVEEKWLKHARETISKETLSGSLPHRTDREREAIAACFAGVTTWQNVCAEFGIDFGQIRDLTC